MSKTIIKNGDTVFSTGVWLIKDDSIPGGWQVGGFEDDTYIDGLIVNSEQDEEGDIIYFTEDNK